MDNRYDVIVVGGGPAGSTTAAYLARHGHRTLLLERSRFPRHRIGESLLPSLMPVLEDFGVVDACRKAGFVEKTGATFIWGKTREPWDICFADTPFLPSSIAFHVERSVFDQILLDNARRCGAEVHMNATVLGATMDEGRVTGVSYRDNDTGAVTSAQAKFVVDASGSSSVVGRRVTERRYDDQLRQIALYGYFKNVRGADNFRRAHIIIESCPKGWFWFIPMNSERLGDVSLGLVTGREFEDEVRAKGAQAFYDEARSEAPYITELLGPQATRIDDMYTVRDWAYTCDETAGPGYYLAGDAAAFLDPLLSTGVSLAMLAGYSASVCIHTALLDPSMEKAAATFYSNNYRQMYEVTRDFLHYFYAGNASAHPNELFWEARRMLKFDENIGAKQAFSFFINTIPGNPHPALQKQIPLFHQFMRNLDHPLDEMKAVPDLEKMASGTLKSAGSLDDRDIPVVNGRLESTWRINRNSHTLEPMHGVSFDRDRPVFSSTSSWLLGRNVAPLDEDSCKLLELMDGEAPWSSVVGRYAGAMGVPLEQGRQRASEILTRLLAENYVLVRDRGAAQ
ncbi:NAD(P)/FAD-dependent oxidoreductase [Sorangium sp. So ce1335]|uniref:NAD(P)/FAD-dependent oxidoreductase n=1 Tax=Sorangium sp. So ce1335 TaxID=3133335 RepID=UPI003F62A543